MSVLRNTFLVGLALHTTSVLSTAPLGYAMETLSWEVDVFPGQPAQILNGTVEDVYAQLHQLNPAHAVFARSEPPPTALEARGGGAEEELRKLGGEAERLVKIVAAPIIIGNKTSEALKTECERWQTELARCIALFEGVQHLVKVPGKPRNGPGPGNCGRVSCSWGAAMFWCNDNPHPYQLPSFKVIAQAAFQIGVKCGICGFGGPGAKDRGDDWGSGQIFFPEGWNVIIKNDKHDC